MVTSDFASKWRCLAFFPRNRSSVGASPKDFSSKDRSPGDGEIPSFIPENLPNWSKVQLEKCENVNRLRYIYIYNIQNEHVWTCYVFMCFHVFPLPSKFWIKTETVTSIGPGVCDIPRTAARHWGHKIHRNIRRFRCSRPVTSKVKSNQSNQSNRLSWFWILSGFHHVVFNHCSASTSRITSRPRQHLSDTCDISKPHWKNHGTAKLLDAAWQSWLGEKHRKFTVTPANVFTFLSRDSSARHLAKLLRPTQTQNQHVPCASYELASNAKRGL